MARPSPSAGRARNRLAHGPVSDHPGPPDWDRVLGALGEDVARIQDWEALDGAYRQAHAHDPAAVSASLRTNLSALYMRTAGVANLLGVTADQATQLWGELDDWAAAAATLDGVPAEQIRYRWHTAADTDTSGWAGQATALATVGVDVEASPALPVPDALRTAITSELGPVHAQFLPARDTELRTAVDAAIPDTDEQPPSPEPRFSDAPAPEEPWDGDNPGTQPVFLSAQASPWAEASPW